MSLRRYWLPNLAFVPAWLSTTPSPPTLFQHPAFGCCPQQHWSHDGNHWYNSTSSFAPSAQLLLQDQPILFWSLSPPQGSQDNSICCCQGKGCQAKRSASAEPLALKSSLWFCHALFVAWIHEELLPLPAQLNCTTVGGLNCVFKQAPCCSVSHSFFFSFHSNFIYIIF